MQQLAHLCGEQAPHAGHICAFFDSRKQKQETLTPFLRGAVERGEEVLQIVDGAELAQLESNLARVRASSSTLRVCNDMSWVGSSQEPVEHVLEFEARLNQLLPDNKCTLVCLYDLGSIPFSMMSDILFTHPYVILKGELRRNPYYIEPAEYIEKLRQRSA